ncbi:unnamed protein product [Strongylus vulgaris]|uniref:SEC63 domain-containing protein n=1 Tax=Strongylus vulgaris TaxID=40348 RepID=A0A3P7IHG9_STRVU|nr:unnamed protein product [Strongylus vulgaris]
MGGCLLLYTRWSFHRCLPRRCTATSRISNSFRTKVESVFELLELDDDIRRDILRMEDVQLADVAKFCNNYPSIEVEHELESDAVNVGDSLLVNVTMERENHVNGLAPPVVAPLFPQKRKEEGWWLVVGDPAANALYSIKRLTINEKAKMQLDFVAQTAGRHEYKLYFICDSYLGADQEFDFSVKVEGILTIVEAESGEEMMIKISMTVSHSPLENPFVHNTGRCVRDVPVSYSFVEKCFCTF